MDSPSANSATQRSDLAENPPFLGGNFFGIMPDYAGSARSTVLVSSAEPLSSTALRSCFVADGSEHGANFEWEMLLAPVPNSEKKMASAKKVPPQRVYRWLSGCNHRRVTPAEHGARTV
jgi:hypothetical protein